MSKSNPKKDTEDEAKDRLYEGLSKCLEGGHVSFAKFPVQGADGISLLHACSQCGLMFWEK
jgi:hypothetical protein